MKESLISIRHLNKTYGKKIALQDVNLEIGRGMFGLLGRNGAGKTTLMRTLAALLPKMSGDITICGIPVENVKEIRRSIGYLPQEFSLYPSMSVAEAMDYLGLLAGMSGRVRKERAAMLLERVNLAGHRSKKVKALSGGMKRRLGIAQALLHDPKVLIVDEPTAGLDPEERIRFRNLLSEVAAERAVILSTHIVGDIEATCEDIAILDSGRLLYRGTVDALLQSARGQVYSMTAGLDELSEIKTKYAVTGMLTQGSRAIVRFVSRVPAAAADVCEPNMEDAYMLYLHKHAASSGSQGGGD